MNRTLVLNKGFAVALLLLPLAMLAQDAAVSLDSCYVWAQRNYPLVRRAELIAQTREYSLENIAKGYLPQVSLNAQATYQSDVTRISIPIPNMNITPLSKDQYKATLDVNQTLYDGGTMAAQKSAQVAASALDSAALRKDLFLLRERVNQLFFGALLLQAQREQVVLLISELQETQKRVEGALSGGTAFKSDLAQLQAEILTQGQRKLELEAGIGSYLQLLGVFIGKPIGAVSQLVSPVAAVSLERTNTRPELRIFALQQELYDRQLRVFDTYRMPKLSVFGQGGYGKPALNVLKNEFDWYYIGGVRLNWNIAALYSLRTDRLLLQAKRSQVDIDREVFLFNNNLNLVQQDAEATKLAALLASDAEIIRLKETVKEAAKAKYDNGVITLNDYLKEVDAVSRAKFNEALHRVQSVANQYNKQFTLGSDK